MATEQVLAYIRQKVDAGAIDFLPLSALGTQRSMARALLGWM
ncbi:hypothetical protein [Xylophilus rhododendri]|nr:hypothetical protein [Xylophilus rhododendri]